MLKTKEKTAEISFILLISAKLCLKLGFKLSHIMRKPVLRVPTRSNTNRAHSTTTEDGQKLEISNLESRGIVLCSEIKGAIII